jgi:two-component system chemotaxis response regulator CheB
VDSEQSALTEHRRRLSVSARRTRKGIFLAKRHIIAIGASTGGITALKRLCSSFPADLTATVFIVIHVGSGGNNVLAGILDKCSALPVATAIDEEPIEPGHIYVAPADHHLMAMEGMIRLGRGPRENMSRPAIDPLFRSVAASYGPEAVALLLTGDLNDGAAGIADVKRCRGITVVQNPSDAQSPNMPLAALEASDVDYRAPLSQLCGLLQQLVSEDAGLATEIPPDILLEIGIALGRPVTSSTIKQIAKPTTLTCPGCGGVLSQIESSPPLRFRCQVGHGYTADILAKSKEDAVDEAMRVALRIIDERAALAEKMVAEERKSGRVASFSGLQSRAGEYRARADTLRQALLDLE